MKNVRVVKGVLRPDGGEIKVFSVVVQSGIFVYTFYCRTETSANELAKLLSDQVAAMLWGTADDE
jgi:hypothetical protein